MSDPASTGTAARTPAAAHGRELRRQGHEAIEDYAKSIYALSRRREGPVSTTELAERLGVSPGSVTAMVKRMAGLGLLEHEPYKGVELTPEGERTALEMIRHHRLLEAYLAEVLGMPWDRVHAEAEVLEHYISEELEELIAAALGDPERDPHGDPIPGPDLELAEERSVPLGRIDAGAAARFVRVSDADPGMLRHLAGVGITPGTVFEVVRWEPYGGPLIVRRDGSEHALGPELVGAIQVEPVTGNRSPRR